MKKKINYGQTIHPNFNRKCAQNQHARQSKILDLLSATALVAPELSKPQAIISDITVRRSASDLPDLRGHIARGDQQACYLQVFQRFSQKED